MTDATVPAVPIMSKAKARRLIDRIKTKAESLWADIVEAHDGRAWESLGYKSWAECAEIEFGKSRAHSYKLLNQSRLMGELEAVASTPEVSRARDTLSQRDVDRMTPETRSELVDDFAAAETAEQAESAVEKAKDAAQPPATGTDGPTPERGVSEPNPNPVPRTDEWVADHSIPLPDDLWDALHNLASRLGESSVDTAVRILRSVIETGEVPSLPAANGRKARAPTRGAAMEAAMARQGLAAIPRQSNIAGDGHKHLATKAKQGASGMVRCDVCGIPKVGTRWVEP